MKKANDIGSIIEYLNSAGGDCIGCGFCCLQTKCWVGHRVHRGDGPCPSLEWDGERHNCKLMQIPGKLGEGYRNELHAGAGCCSGLNSWRNEPLRDRIPVPKQSYSNPIPSIMQKFLQALGSEMISSDKMYFVCSKFKENLIKDGVPEDDAKAITSKAVAYILENRSKFNTEFMG